MQRGFLAGVSVFAIALGATAVLWISHARKVEAHCQVPCGIYDDPARIARLKEDAATIAKATDQIGQLAGQHDAQAFNQAARWVSTKETHATHIIDVVSEYFLTQKVKTVAPGADGYDAYLKKLADHHAVMVAAMKTKQNVSASHVHTLQHAIDTLGAYYKK
ncbi:MAG: superoxide dismutase [Ni] [Phycisphaerae bacterium]